MDKLCIFGLPGSPLAKLLIDIDSAKNIKFFNLGHEDLNGHAAQSYSRAHKRGLPGVLMCTHGPGLASCINSIGNAKKESHSLIILSVYEHNNEDNRQNFQYWDTLLILGNIIEKDSVFKIERPTQTNITSTFSDAISKTMAQKCPVAILFETKQLKQYSVSSRMKFNTFTLLQSVFKNNKFANYHRTTKQYPKTSNALVIIDEFSVSSGAYIKTFLTQNPGLHYVTTFSGRIDLNLTSNIFLGILGSTYYTQAIDNILKQTDTIFILNYDIDSELEGPDFFHQKYGIPVNTLQDNGKIVFKIPEQALESFVYSTEPKSFSTGKTIRPTIQNIPDTLNELYWTSGIVEAYDMYCKQQSSNSVNHIVFGIGDFGYALGNLIVPKYPSHFFASTKWGSIGIAIPNSVGICAATPQTTPVTIFTYEGDGSLLWSSPVLFSLPVILTEQLKRATIIITIFCNNFYGAVKDSIVQSEQNLNTPDTAYTSVIVPNVPIFPSKAASVYNCSNVDEYISYMRKIPQSPGLHVFYCFLSHSIQTNSTTRSFADVSI